MATKLKIEYWPVERLKPYAKNAKLHPDAQVEAIAASIGQFGMIQPVLVDGKDEVIAGHGRLLSVIKRGDKTVPVISVSHLTPAQVKAYRVLDNEIAARGSWSPELLQAELAALVEANFPLVDVGFDEQWIKDNLTIPEPELPRASLSDRFGVPPFSVLNAREGWWQARKDAWVRLGIQSELGRGENALDMSAAMAGITDPEKIKDWNEQRRKVKLHTNTPHEGKGMADGLVAVRQKQKDARKKPNATPGGGTHAS